MDTQDKKEEPPKKRRGRKPKPKVPEDPNKKKARRGRRRKCDRGIDDADKNVGFIKNLETLDVSKNKILMKNTSSTPTNPDDYDIIKYPSGLVIRKKKVTNKMNLQRLTDMNNKTPKDDNKKEDENECIIDFDMLEDTSSTPKTSSKNNKVLTLDSLIKKNDSSSKNTKSQTNIIKKNSKSKEVHDEIIEEEKVLKYKKPKKRKVRVMHKYGDDLSVVPLKSDLRCWWCTFTFDTDACFIPTKWDKYHSKYRITGNFCSWNCAKAYYIKDRMSIKNDHSMYVFTKMLRDMGHPINVKIAPPKEVLEAYGGILSIEQYRESFYTTDCYTLQSCAIEYDDSINIIFKSKH